MNYDYQLVDDGGVSQLEDVQFLIPIGTMFECEYGKYKMSQHYKQDDGSILPICDRIEDKTDEFKIIELQSLVGDFILKETAGKELVRGDGYYYHYSVVCNLLKKYKEL